MLDIRKELENPDRKIACIEGDFELSPRSVSAQRFKQTRIWNFRSAFTVAEFFDEFIYWISNGIQDQPEKYPVTVKARLAEFHSKVGYSPSLIVLQGFEALQYGEGDDYGLIKDDSFRDWIRSFAMGGRDHFCVISGDLPLFDLIDFTTVECFKNKVQNESIA